MNYYEILECDRDATFEVIKRNYQRLIRDTHPDKRDNTNGNDDFVKIDAAWKVLRDEHARKEYDAVQLQTNLDQQGLIYAEINVAELEFDCDLIAKYPCRCGGFIQIDKSWVNDECEVECSECSNCILIKNS